ncbi:hypothetical protein ACLOJK_026888 [Asimina triloba]
MGCRPIREIRLSPEIDERGLPGASVSLLHSVVSFCLNVVSFPSSPTSQPSPSTVSFRLNVIIPSAVNFHLNVVSFPSSPTSRPSPSVVCASSPLPSPALPLLLSCPQRHRPFPLPPPSRRQSSLSSPSAIPLAIVVSHLPSFYRISRGSVVVPIFLI